MKLATIIAFPALPQALHVSPSATCQIDLPGPAERYDINVDEASFARLREWHREYGDLYALAPLRRRNPSVVVNDPDVVRQVLIGNHRNYRKGVGFERVKMLLGNGIIVSDGDFWRSQRRMLQPAFHKRVIENMAVMMQRLSRAQADRWHRAAEQGETIDLTLDMVELSLEVVLRALFGDDLDWLVARHGRSPFDLLAEDLTRDLQLAVRFRQLGSVVQSVIDRRRGSGREEEDFLGHMMAARDKDTGATMPDKAIIDEVMTIIIAGHETTAGTLNWAWYLLSQHPEERALVAAEADALGHEPTFADLPELAYTRQVIEETLRLYPPVWLFTRKAIGADRFRDVEIPADSNIFLCPWIMHHDERFWDAPDEFRPARFSKAESAERHRATYYPFSLGSRRCIGEFFSMVDMQLHMALVSQELELEHVPDKPIEIEPHVNLRSRHSILMRPRKRR